VMFLGYPFGKIMFKQCWDQLSLGRRLHNFRPHLSETVLYLRLNEMSLIRQNNYAIKLSGTREILVWVNRLA
jgi:hypothetical protein